MQKVPGRSWPPGQLLISGDYPYYRDDPQLWSPKLRRIAEAGIEVVTCYVPWRHHLVDGQRACEVDFSGAGNRDLTGFLDQVGSAGLRAVLKPGPFVHAEIQFGGLPDVLSPTRTPSLRAASDRGGKPLRLHGLLLPSIADPSFLEQARWWYGQVLTELVLSRLHPGGPVIGVQVGNEGAFCDAAASPWHSDAVAAAAMPAPPTDEPWLRGPSGLTTSALAGTGLSAAAAVSWMTRSAQATARFLEALLDDWPADLPVYVNFPPPGPDQISADGVVSGVDSWLCRVDAVAQTRVGYAVTGWAGSAVDDDLALARLVAGYVADRGPNCEENWGHLWFDPGLTTPRTPLFHHVLALGLGCLGVNVYNACATARWGPTIARDPSSVEPGEDLSPYRAPYCEAAPITVDGEPGPAYPALRTFLHVLRADSATLARSTPMTRLLLTRSPAVSAVRACGALVSDGGRSPSTLAVLRHLVPVCLAAGVHPDLGTFSSSTGLTDADLTNLSAVAAIGTDLVDPHIRAVLAAHHARGCGVLIVGSVPAAGGAAAWLRSTTTSPASDGSVPPVVVLAAAEELADPAWLGRLGMRPAVHPNLVHLHRRSGAVSFLFVLNRRAETACYQGLVGGVEVEVELPAAAACMVSTTGSGLRSCYLMAGAAGAGPPMSGPRVRVGTRIVMASSAVDLGVVVRDQQLQLMSVEPAAEVWVGVGEMLPSRQPSRQGGS